MIPPLELEYIDGRVWKVTRVFAYETSVVPGLVIIAPKGFITDFNSTPRLLWRLLPPTDYAQAGVIHDVLYRSNGVTRLQADQIHREMLRRLGAPEWKVLLYYSGLRIGGGSAWQRYRDNA